MHTHTQITHIQAKEHLKDGRTQYLVSCRIERKELPTIQGGRTQAMLLRKLRMV
jgi:hypothetical protein